MTASDRIRIRREELGMTQDELAKKLGYKSRSSVNKVENNRDLSLKKVKEYASALDCTPSYLLGWEDDTSDLDIVNTDTMLDKRLMAYAERLLNLNDEDRELILSMIDKLS